MTDIRTHCLTHLQNDQVQFNYRVAAVIQHEQHILLQGEPESTIWTLPGGSIQLHEASQTALQRELYEELAIQAHVERLLWIAEQFYHDGEQYHHELCMIYAASLPEQPPQHTQLEPIITSSDGSQGAIPLLFRWFALASLDTLPLYPTFLRSSISTLPATPTHIVISDQLATS
ncbi:MAG TPA: NUDIX hydrolase [Dictyobacter sp.]|nr:NUDIX hydrolase [Dictyobacter sp.]